MRCLYLFLLSILFINFNSAQSISPKFGKKDEKHKSWEFGLNNGMINYAGDLNRPKFFINESHPCLGFYSQYFISDNFSIKPSFMWGKFSGADANLGNSHLSRNYSFTTNIVQLMAQTAWHPFGHVRFIENNTHRYKGKLSPYIHLGISVFRIKPKVNFNFEGETTSINIDKSNTKNLLAAIPFGSGLRFDLNQEWTIGAELTTQTPLNDYLDGISQTANPKKNDWIHTITFQFAYKIIYQKDSDKDGIVDKEDACPDLAGFPNAKGCPDRDNDGILDKDDLCPDDFGKLDHKGCPDQDADGIPDYLDHCPFSQGLKKLNGCPDKDKDGVADYKDLCPDVVGSVNARGCPDEDDDGIMDKQDACPTEKGTYMTNGCPVKDWDNDGIPDYADACPDKAGDKSNNGCPSEKSKPIEVIKEMTVEKVEEKIQNRKANDELLKELLSIGSKIDFIPKTIKLKDVSYLPLNQLVELMKQNKDLNIKIVVACKETKDIKLNQKFAEARARSIFSFLLKSGIIEARINYEGKGEALVANAKNIVEFKLQ